LFNDKMHPAGRTLHDVDEKFQKMVFALKTGQGGIAATMDALPIARPNVRAFVAI
jgi:hypothetical protein